MKKSARILCLFLVAIMLAGFASGCVNKTMVEITVDGDQIGMALSNIPVTVKVNGKETPCRVEWAMLDDAMVYYSIPTETLEEGHDYMAYIYYDADTDPNDENLEITVDGAALDHSAKIGEEMMTAVHINLLEKGNLTLVCSGLKPGENVNPYIAIRKDLDFVLFDYSWTVVSDDESAPADKNTVVEYGKAYELALEIYPEEGFNLNDWPVVVKCGNGDLVSIEQQGDVVYATIRYYYIMATVHEFFAPNVQIEVGSEQIGSALSEVPVSLMVRGKRTDCRAEWQMLNDAQDAYVEASGTLEEGKDYLVNVYYTADLTEEDLDVDKIAVFGAELDHSEIVGDDEILTVVRVNLLEKGNLTLTVGSAYVGMPIEHAYCAVKLDGELLQSEHSWSILKGDAEEAADESEYFEEGSYYQINIRFIAPDDFNPDEWDVRLNCEGGELLSLEPDGAEYVAKIGFDYTGGHVCDFVLNEEKPATNTCEKAGEKYYICLECGEEKTKSAPALGHDPDWNNATYVAPQNCAQNGEERAECRICGKTQTRKTDAVGDHTWKETGREDNCDKGVTISYACSVCGKTKSDKIAGSHEWNETGREGLCNLGMTIRYTCGKCGGTKTESAPIRAHDPDWNNATYVAPQNCAQNGEERAECRICGKTQTRRTNAVGDHIWQETGREDNCDKGVTISYACSVCGKAKSEKIAGSHEWNETGREDLCNLGLTIFYTCGKCGATKNEVGASAHSWERIDQEGSCPYGLQLVHKCSKCGAIDTSQWIYPGDHSFGSAIYWNNHVHVRYCTECGDMTRENHTTDGYGYCASCDTWIIN